jgi:hypothetical protein
LEAQLPLTQTAGILSAACPILHHTAPAVFLKR